MTNFGSSVKFLISSQLINACLGLIFQSVFLQLISTELLGILNLQLLTSYHMILKMVREPFRRIVPRFPNKSVSFAWFTLPFGLMVSLIHLIISLATNSSWRSVGKPFAISFFLFNLSALIELGFEPFYTQVSSNYTLRRSIDTKSSLVHYLLSIFLIKCLKHNQSSVIIAFGFIQIIDSLHYFYQYYHAAPRKNIVFQFDSEIYPFYTAFFWDKLANSVLSQGGVLLITALSDPYHQGVYFLLENYGGMILKLIFAPIEDSLRSYYSSKETQNDPSTFYAISIFSQWISIAFAFWGTLYAPHILSMLPRSSKLFQLTRISSTYCVLLPLYILNGIFEAYLHAKSSLGLMKTLRRNCIVISAVYFASAFYLVSKFPSRGILYAEMINYSARIAQAVYYITIPKVDAISLVAASGSIIICYYYNYGLMQATILGLLTALIVAYRERKSIMQLKSLF